MLACLALSACAPKDPEGTIYPLKKNGVELLQIEHFGAGDSPPFRLDGGRYKLIADPAPKCSDELQLSIRSYDGKNVVMPEQSGETVIYALSGVPKGLYIATGKQGNTSCGVTLSLMTEK